MSFVHELTRAAAARGKLDPIYQELSDDWTLILQQLFPVAAMIGPGLAEPGHILLRSRTVYLDSDELLGSRDEIVAGALQRRAILRTYGVAIHEVFHAKHTKLWVSDHDAALSASDDPDDRQLAVDRALLEEPRMEAHGCREFGEQTRRGRFIRLALEAAVLDCILPRFADQFAQAAAAGQPVTRDMAGRSMVYVRGRTHYGVIRPSSLGALQRIWEQTLGAADVQAIDDLLSEVVWQIPDGENAPLSQYAAAYRDIIGPPDPPPSGGTAGTDVGDSASGTPAPGSGGDPADGQGSPGGSGDAADEDSAAGSGGETPAAGSLKDALEAACETGRSEQLEQLNEDVDLQSTLEQAANGGHAEEARKGGGTGAPTGRIPDRGVFRPPFPDEVQAAKRLADQLRKARNLGQRRIDKRIPGGRFNSRAHVRGRFERALGRPASTGAWTITKEITAPIEEPHILLVIDTSGSMGFVEHALGPIMWIVTTAFRTVGGRVATVLFGNAAHLLADGTEPMKLVPGIRVGGGTAFAGDAIVMGCEHLDMQNTRRPRAVYIISDGGWYDTEAGVRKIRELAELGVPTIHLSIGGEPLSVEASRVCVINDPAECQDVIASDTIAALNAQAKRGAPSRR